MPAKVKGLGFQLRFADRIKIGNFYRQLEQMDGRGFDYFGSNMIYTSVHANMIVGCILSFKDHRKFINTEKDANGNFKVNKQELKSGEFGAEAGLFCINPATDKGIFTTYFGGLGAGKLRWILKDSHEILRRACIEKYLDEEAEERADADEKELRREARAMLQGKFGFDILCSDEDLDEIISHFDRIKRAGFTVKAGLLDAPMLKPLQAHNAGSTVGVNFSKDSTAASIVEAIKAVLRPRDAWDKFQAVRLMGRSLEAEEISYQLGKNKNRYFEMSYDEYVDALPDTTWNDYVKCPAMAAVIKALKDWKSTFGAPPNSTAWLPADPMAGLDLSYE